MTGCANWSNAECGALSAHLLRQAADETSEALRECSWHRKPHGDLCAETSVRCIESGDNCVRWSTNWRSAIAWVPLSSVADRCRRADRQRSTARRAETGSGSGEVMTKDEAKKYVREYMSRDWYIEAHEREVAEYMDRHPNASWDRAYNATADRAYDRMRDEMADAADMGRMRAKEGGQ
jgi:hypothetical protein